MTKKSDHPVEAFERSIIERAEFFTAFLQVAPGDRIRHELATQAEAEGVAQLMANSFQRAVLVYAVDPEGRQALAATIRPQKDQPMPTQSEARAPREKPPVTARAAAVARASEAPTKPRPAPGGNRGAPPPKPPTEMPEPDAPRMRKGALEALEAARKGVLPPAPDFTADTHKRFRPALLALQALIEAKDIAGLKAFPINPISTSPKALERFRNFAVIALEAAPAEVL